jgi:hypothetical protein
MDRALYSIEETRVRLGGISRSSLYAMLRAGDLPSVVIGCRRFVSGGDCGTDQSSHHHHKPIAGRGAVTAAVDSCRPTPSFNFAPQQSLSTIPRRVSWIRGCTHGDNCGAVVPYIEGRSYWGGIGLMAG